MVGAVALQSRLDSLMHTPSWARFLPDGLRPAGVPKVGSCGGGGISRSTCAGPDSDGGVSTEDNLDIVRPRRAPGALLGRAWRLSRDPAGCREVQLALERAGSEKERAAIVQELHGHVWEAMCCSCANHVLQKVISTTRPQSCQFMIDEILRSDGAVLRALSMLEGDEGKRARSLVLGMNENLSKYRYGRVVLNKLRSGAYSEQAQ